MQRSESEEIKRIDTITQEISPTFCFAKWYHANIYFQTGETHSCYHPAPHKIDTAPLLENPSAIHNTAQKKQERAAMMRGEKPSGCNYCWKIEALGKDYVSDRKQRNQTIFFKHRLAAVKEGGAEFDVNPEYLEVSFGNECNFRCGYCHPKASSRYYQEIKQHGPYTNVKNHRCDIDWFQIFEEENNPYLDAFWRWWPELSKELHILRITGGEPTIQQSTYKLFDMLDADPKPELELNCNSNLGGKPKQLEKFTNRVNDLLINNKIRRFKMFTSIDTWGKRAEYIRDGLDIEVFERNLDYFMRNCEAPMVLMITFNIFSVTTFRTLLEKILEWRAKYNDVETHRWQRLGFDTPHLKEPLQYDINILPKNYMSYMHDHLQFIKENVDDNRKDAFSTIEYEKFRRVVDYMDTTEYPLEKVIQGRRDFYNFFEEQGRRRGVDHKQVFPEMSDFFELCSKYV